MTVSARLLILFAPEAPVAVVYRQGPHRWTQMWRWNTDTDEFAPGQWIKGRVHDDSTLSADGRYVDSRIMSGNQHTVLSRPPYFTALAVTVAPLCASGVFFLPDGSLSGVFGQYRALQERCPIRTGSPVCGERGYRTIENRPIKSGDGAVFGTDQRHRCIVVSEGRIGVAEGETTRWLIDLDPYEPTNVPPPDWALDW